MNNFECAYCGKKLKLEKWSKGLQETMEALDYTGYCDICGGPVENTDKTAYEKAFNRATKKVRHINMNNFINASGRKDQFQMTALVWSD